MKIENEILHFKSGYQSSGIAISDLQSKYLSVLENNSSIEQTVQFFLQQGWLVSFTELYDLLEKMVYANLILNTNIVSYFRTSQSKLTANFGK